jgi:PKD repeat protein
MATIGRISGPALYADLDRQGVNLQFTTNNLPLLSLDFANFTAAINGVPTADKLTVYGSAKLDELRIAGSVVTSLDSITLNPANALYLGSVAKVKIDGGLPNLVLATDGFGNLSWRDLSNLSQASGFTGNTIALGTPLDGSLVTNSAYKYFTPTTTVTDAIDNLNQVMFNVYNNTYVGNVSFTANVTSGPSPITVSFTPSVVGNANTYFWDFGDGVTSTLQNPTHTYSNVGGGQFSVYFKASNSAGTLAGVGTNGNPLLAQGSYADVTAQNYITLYTPTPIAAFTLSSASINSASNVTLTNTSQYADSYTIFWGDGTQDVVTSNSTGSPGHPITHTYTNVLGDTSHVITLNAHSATAGPSGVTTTSAPVTVRVYSVQTPEFSATTTSGTNQHNTLPNGLTVGFVNNTATALGATALFPANRYEWDFGDGTIVSVDAGVSAAGDVGIMIHHTYTLANPSVQQVFQAVLKAYNGYSTSPFSSSATNITVTPVPTALFTGTALAVSDRTGDTAQVGYLGIDLNGINRAIMSFTNTSVNADLYAWDFGDGHAPNNLVPGDAGTPTGAAIENTYATTGQFAVSLLAHGPASTSASDDTLVNTSYITVLPLPAPPPLLSTKTISVASTGTLPKLAANATNNSGSTLPTAGTTVSRVPTNLTPTVSNVIVDAYNAYTGTLSAKVNGVTDGTVALTGSDDTGTYGALSVTADRDAHAVDATVYPSNFYKVFSASVSKSTPSMGVGYSTFQISHSVTGSTNVAGFVVDDVITIPTLDISAVTMSTVSIGVPKYESGIPYFNINGVVGISGLKATSWIGQTYTDLQPLTVSPGNMTSGSGQVILSQTKTYANLNGSPSFLTGGIPNANTGKVTAYTMGTIPVNITGSAVGAGKIAVSLQNIIGPSAAVELPTNINVYSAPQAAGINELNIPVSPTLGANFTNNGLRIVIAGTGATPVYTTATNYYVDRVFTGSINIAGTDEAVVRFGKLSNDTTNYSTYLPAGPDLSSRTGTQYFRFAFTRAQVANFTITYTGKISGLYIAAPGTLMDATSTVNGWADASIPYAGAGVPGENAIAGGNGSNGCAKTAGDVLPVGQTVTNRACTLTLGSENMSNAFGNQVFVNIALAPGDTLTSISVS